MKRFLCMAATLLVSTTVFAAGELEINDSPLTLVLNDHNQARVSSCNDFISLRKAGETVKDLPGLSDPDYHTAEDALFSCWLKAYTVEHNMIPFNEKKPTLGELLTHFPASSAYTVSHEEHENIEQHYAGKTITEYTPDLKAKDDRMESAASSTGYVLDDYYSFTDKEGDHLYIVALTGYSVGGTVSNKVYYRIDNMNNRVWKITRLNENSPL